MHFSGKTGTLFLNNKPICLIMSNSISEAVEILRESMTEKPIIGERNVGTPHVIMKKLQELEIPIHDLSFTEDGKKLAEFIKLMNSYVCIDVDLNGGSREDDALLQRFLDSFDEWAQQHPDILKNLG